MHGEPLLGRQGSQGGQVREYVAANYEAYGAMFGQDIKAKISAFGSELPKVKTPLLLVADDAEVGYRVVVMTKALAVLFAAALHFLAVHRDAGHAGSPRSPLAGSRCIGGEQPESPVSEEHRQVRISKQRACSEHETCVMWNQVNRIMTAPRENPKSSSFQSRYLYGPQSGLHLLSETCI